MSNCAREKLPYSKSKEEESKANQDNEYLYYLQLSSIARAFTIVMNPSSHSLSLWE